MIKSNVCFFYSDPKREKCHVPAEHRRANCLSLIKSHERNAFPCVNICVVCATVSLFLFPPYPHILPPSSLFSGAAGCYLELTLMCAVTPAAAGSRNETHMHTHRGLKIAGLCVVSLYTPFLLIIFLLLLTTSASQPTVSDP